MTEAQRLRLLELAVSAGAAPDMAVEYARKYAAWVTTESRVVPSGDSTQDSGVSST